MDLEENISWVKRVHTWANGTRYIAYTYVGESEPAPTNAPSKWMLCGHEPPPYAY
jgi:hypothetical protein